MIADLGVIFAGGQGRRMGGVDKGTLTLDGTPLIEIVASRLRPACRRLAVAAPDPPDWLEHLDGAGFIEDVTIDGAPIGPAGALLGALDYLRETAPDGWLLTVPVDVPFLPEDFGAQLAAGRDGHLAAIAEAHGRLHPVIGLWSAACQPTLRRAIVEENCRSLHGLAKITGAAIVPVAAASRAFLNINQPEDLERAKREMEG